MNSLKAKIISIWTIIKENKSLVVGAFLTLLFLYIVFLTVTSPSQTPNAGMGTGQTTMKPRDTLLTITVTPYITGTANLYETNIKYTPSKFSEEDLKGIKFTKTPLSDGTTKYTYESTNPKRPNEVIVKDGVVIYQRSLVNNKYIYHYTNTMGAPDFVFQSSKFYGSNTMTYVYINKGTAFVADAKTTLVKEQLSFQPTTLDQFKQKYGQDIADFTVIPTEPDEEYIRAEDNR